MCRKLALSLGAATLLVSLGAGELSAANNPSGWIQTDGWNYLMPLTQTGGCGGGGAARMQGNWITPHVIGLENPKAGTSYFAKSGASAKIDYPNTAGTTGWGGAGIAGDPTWVTNSFIEAAFPALALSMPNGDVVDYGDEDGANGLGLYEYINSKIVPSQPGPPPPLPGDNVLGIATTYVRNTTGVGLEVEVCTASDDSIQVWVNNALVTNVSACRGTAANCAETRTAILPPGLSKIATLVWEGGGGWGFRLGLRIGGVLITDATAAAAGLEFVGPGAAADVGQTQYTVSRNVPSQPFGCPPIDPVTVTLQGSGTGNGGDLLTVVEDVFASNGVGADITISSVSNGGVVTDILPPPSSVPVPAGEFADHRVIGTDNGGGSTSSYDAVAGEYTSISTTGGDIWDGGDDFEFMYNRVSGDFDISIEWTSRVHNEPGDCEDVMTPEQNRWGKFGIMARTKRERCSRSTMLQDHLPCLLDTTRLAGRTDPNGCNAMYERRVQEVDNYHPTFIRLTRRGNVFQAWYSDVLPADPANDANWTMSAGAPDDWGLDAPAEVYLGIGNSEHNSTGADMLTAKFKLLNLDATILPVNPPPAPIGKRITWTGVTRDQLNTGLSYDVQFTKGTVTMAGKVVGEVSINDGSPPITFDNLQGPVGIFDNHHDVGNPRAAGSTTFDGTSYTIQGFGDDIWDGGDDFHFAYSRVKGDFDFVAHFTDVPDPNCGRWGRYGPMARLTCARDSKFTMLEQIGTHERDAPNHHIRTTHNNAGGNANTYFVDNNNLGCNTGDANLLTQCVLPWVKLSRRGNTFTTYASLDDGSGNPAQWCVVGSDNWTSAQGAVAQLAAQDNTVLVGIAIHNHGSCANTILSATFDQAEITEVDCGAEQACESAAEIVTVNFDAPDGTDPALGGLVNVQGGDFRPVIMGNRLRLTQEGIGGSANAVWSSTEGLPLTEEGFVFEFDAFMSHSVLPGDANPADGMTFAVVEGDEAYAANLRGDGGGALGFEGNSLRANTECHASFAIELDNWVGGGDNEPAGAGSPDADGRWHVGLDVNSSVSSVQTSEQFGVPTANLPDIFDPAGVHVEVHYAASGRINVFVSSNAEGGVGRTQVLGACIAPLQGEVLLGFTAGTGGATATQEVDNAVLSQICCDPSSESVTIDGPEEGLIGVPVVLTANAGGLDGPATYTWSIVSGTATLVPTGNTATVTATAEEDVVVKVVVDDGVCGGSAEAIHTISFGPIGGLQKPNDMNGDGNLDISDPVATLNHLFLGGVGPACGDNMITHPSNLILLDANASGAIDISDPVYVLNFLFLGGPLPANCADDTCPCIVIVDCPDVCVP